MSEKKEAILKILALCSLLVITLFFLFIRLVFPTNGQTTSMSNSGEIIYQIPYTKSIDLNLGFVQVPMVNLPLKTTKGFINTPFLLDTGAIISTLPLQAAKNLGVDIVDSKRITLQGFSGMPVFAYLGTITVKIGDKNFDLPATFSDVSKENILGRKGLFDTFSINFDYEKQLITLSRKGNK